MHFIQTKYNVNHTDGVVRPVLVLDNPLSMNINITIRSEGK